MNFALAPTPPLHYYQLVARTIPAEPTFLAFLNLLVTRCSNKYNIQQLYVLPTLYLCVV
jgi:hypothetical protein